MFSKPIYNKCNLLSSMWSVDFFLISLVKFVTYCFLAVSNSFFFFFFFKSYQIRFVGNLRHIWLVVSKWVSLTKLNINNHSPTLICDFLAIASIRPQKKERINLSLFVILFVASVSFSIKGISGGTINMIEWRKCRRSR